MLLRHLAFLGAVTLITACDTADKTPESTAPSPDKNSPDEKVWVDLFNGKDLSGWTIKVAGYPAGENALNTFYVKDGLLHASYDEYQEFENRFGHIVYNGGPYSYYELEVEYRFAGEQVNGGPEWALRNNGIMYHAQSASEMVLEQDFPRSMEYQLLGGNGENPRTTGNLCTPGTHVVIAGELRTDHCINSTSETFHGEQWVTAKLVVHGSELAQHIINDQLVMEYNDLQLDDGTPLTSGYIALQAESHPTQFRSVRLLNLEGCMDEKAKNYQSYLKQHDPQACVY